MARFHVRATPPTSPLLFEYGRDFPDFIARYSYARRCRGWRTWRASSGPGSTPITPPMRSRWRRRRWRRIPPDRLAEVVLAPHPATRIVRSRFPAVSIFAANRGDGPVGRIGSCDAGGCAGHAARPGGRGPAAAAGRRGVPGAADRGRAARRGRRGGAGESPEFDLAANIAGMLEAGAFARLGGDDDGLSRKPPARDAGLAGLVARVNAVCGRSPRRR